MHCHRPSKDARTTVVCSVFAGEALADPDLPRFASVGVHPWHADAPGTAETVADMHSLLEDPRCIAVGEIGLDRLRGPALQEQERILRAQLDIAERHAMPVILHDVRCTSEFLRIRKDYSRQLWIMHGFRGSTELARQCLDVGFYLSLGPPLLAVEERGRALCAVIPLERLFLETDDSDAEVREMYDAVGSWTGLGASALRSQLEQNFIQVFGVQP